MKYLFLILMTSASFAQNIQLIDWFAGADIVGTSGDSDAELESDFYVREFEFSAMSKIDQNWNGVMTLSFHKELETEHNEIEVHEAYLSSNQVFNLTNLRIGKFFLGFGRINQFHRHDWNFTDAPFVQKSFFGNEGVKDTGVEFKRNLLALGSTLTVGVTSGNEFDHTNHSHDEDEEHSSAKAPTSYLRFAKFIELTTTKGFETGFNFIHRNDEEAVKRDYIGLDFVFKNRIGNYLETLIESEVWHRTSKEDGEESKDLGAYLYVQKGLDQHHALGLRFDYFKADHHDEEDSEHEHSIDGLSVHSEYKAVSLSYIYSNSEFMKTRFTVEHLTGIEVENSNTEEAQRAFLQFVFNIGAHPSHVY